MFSFDFRDMALVNYRPMFVMARHCKYHWTYLYTCRPAVTLY